MTWEKVGAGIYAKDGDVFAMAPRIALRTAIGWGWGHGDGAEEAKVVAVARELVTKARATENAL